MSLTQKERVSIRNRDIEFGRNDNPVEGCQFPHDHAEAHGMRCAGRIEVHHILPQTFGYIWLEAVKKELDHKINLITVCQNSHVRTPYSIHPDQVGIYFGKSESAGEKLQSRRREKAAQGIPYWNPSYDHLLVFQARRNTRIAQEAGWRFKQGKRADDDDDLSHPLLPIPFSGSQKRGVEIYRAS